MPSNDLFGEKITHQNLDARDEMWLFRPKQTNRTTRLSHPFVYLILSLPTKMGFCHYTYAHATNSRWVEVHLQSDACRRVLIIVERGKGGWWSMLKIKLVWGMLPATNRVLRCSLKWRHDRNQNDGLKPRGDAHINGWHPISSLLWEWTTPFTGLSAVGKALKFKQCGFHDSDSDSKVVDKSTQQKKNKIHSSSKFKTSFPSPPFPIQLL